MATKDDCVFCKIVNGDIPSYKVYEDDKFLAFLDGQPNCRGQTLVVTKDHHGSYVFDLDDDVYEELLKTTKKVAKILEKGLNVNKVALVFEGLGVDHIHAKLYPMHGVGKDFKVHEAEEKVYFKEYPGYVTTKMGEWIDSEDALKIIDEIKENNKNE